MRCSYNVWADAAGTPATRLASVQGIKGVSLLTMTRQEEHSHVRGHLMRAFNADTVAASIWQLSDTVQRSIAAIQRCSAEGPQGDAQSRCARCIDAGAAAPPHRLTPETSC